MNQQNFKVKINSYFKRISRRQIPKFVSIFFLSLFFGLGLNFGFINVINKKYRIYLKQVTNIVLILLSVHLLLPIFYTKDLTAQLLLGISFLQYIIHGLLLYTTKYNLYHFVTDIYKIHNNIYDKEYLFISCLFAYNLMTFAFKIVITYFLCTIKVYQCPVILSTIPSYIFFAPTMAIDVVVVAQIIIYYYVLASLKFMRELMEKKCLDLVNVRKQFIMIADCCDKISSLYGKLTIIELMVNLPRLMTTIVIALQHEAPWVLILGQMSVALQAATQIFAPAALVEMVNEEVESITLHLHRRLDFEKDETTQLEIFNLVEYIKSRRLHPKVFRVLPVDIKLVTIVFDICNVYFVVVFQYAHILN